jgi:hypothetical protein
LRRFYEVLTHIKAYSLVTEAIEAGCDIDKVSADYTPTKRQKPLILLAYAGRKRQAPLTEVLVLSIRVQESLPLIAGPDELVIVSDDFVEEVPYGGVICQHQTRYPV